MEESIIYEVTMKRNQMMELQRNLLFPIVGDMGVSSGPSDRHILVSNSPLSLLKIDFLRSHYDRDNQVKLLVSREIMVKTLASLRKS